MREHEARVGLGGDLTATAGETDIVRMEKDGALLVVRLPEDGGGRLGSCYSACERFISDFSAIGKCSLGCYIGIAVRLGDFPETVRRLRKLADDNVSCASAVMSLRAMDRSSSNFETPDLDAWKILLENDASDALADAAAEYLRKREQAGKLDANALRLLRQDILQLAHIVLAERGVSAHKLIETDGWSEGSLTVPDTLKWVRLLMEAVSTVSDSGKNSELDGRALVAAAIRYVREHLAEDLSRETIADRIGLNPDYFGRVFRKETGLTVTDYVVKERVSMAIRLLENTDQAISRVAVQVGYTNFAYFSQIFRKTTTFTPSEYQKRHRNATKAGFAE